MVTSGAVIDIDRLWYAPAGSNTVTVTATTYNSTLLLGGTSNNSNFSLAGDVNCKTLWIDSGTPGYTSTLDTNGKNITATALWIGTAGDTNYYAKMWNSFGTVSNIDVNGAVNIYTSGGNPGVHEINANNMNWTVSGNWTNSGTFTAGNSTVTFDGSGTSTSTITGNTTFNNFSCVTPSKQLKFTKGSNQTINSTLTLNGQAAGTKVKLRSALTANKWSITLTNQQTVNYVDVQDSDALVSTVTATYSTNTGNNNTNWIFQ